jgi:hypothetical protein
MVNIPINGTTDILTYANTSFVFQNQPYIDFNLWLIIFLLGIGTLIASRCISKNEEVGRFMIGGLGILFGIAASWASLSVANLSYVVGATSVRFINTTNETATYYFMVPVREIVATNGLTILCIIFTVIAVINVVDILLTIIDNMRVAKR